jgi:hypothetical protein
MKKNIILWIASMIYCSNVFASHALGAGISYQCLGNNQYAIYLSFYRDCSGVTGFGNANVNVMSVSCSQNFNVTLTSGPPFNINVCPHELTTCNNGNFPGVQEYLYSATVTLPANCNDWVISYELCCRNASITNLQIPGSRNLYIRSTLDNSNQLCNNAPLFPSLSAQFLCVGHPYTYDPGVVDIEGDSLVFSSINPLNGPNQPIPYVAGYSYFNPMNTTSGFQINQHTGVMTFTPSTIQNIVLTILVREFRNGVLIGSVMRDIQFIILPCPPDGPCPLSHTVWPGDANDDLVADNYDLLPIGLYYDTSGVARDSVSNDWVGFQAINWNDTMFNGSNLKHADCNGDGYVNDADTFAIHLNYGLTHIRSGSMSSRSGEPLFSLMSDKSIYLPGDTVSIYVAIGDTNNPVTNIYGLAFDLSFDNSVVESGTVHFNQTNSFIGNISDNLTLSKLFEQNGKADGAVTRKDKQSASGFGTIALLQFVAKNNSNLPIQTDVSISRYHAVDASADSVIFDMQNSISSFIIDAITGTENLSNQFQLIAIPNPFTHSTTIQYTLTKSANTLLKAYDVLGKTVLQTPASIQDKGNYHLEFKNSEGGKGIYIVELSVDGMKTVQRVVQVE